MATNTTDAQMTDLTVPPPPAPTGEPTTLPTGRDLAAERDAEMKKEADAAKAKLDRFTVRRPTAVSRPAPARPEYESLILKAATVHSLHDDVYPRVSTFFPNLHAFYYLLHVMDHLMCSTKRWFDNSFGWAPPISQMYFAVLIYYQVFRAMHAASAATGAMIQFIITFEQTFNSSELWIPGPLVHAFRSLSAFRPDQDDLFGPVTPITPNVPGHSSARNYRLADTIAALMPNVNFFISRLRTISNIAADPEVTEAGFYSHTNGPLYLASLCRHPLTRSAADSLNVLSPGVYYAHGGSRQLWKQANTYLRVLNIPADLNVTTPDEVSDTWTSAIRFEFNEHNWFGNVAAVMAKYSQFFNGSVALSEIVPTSSAAGAVKLRTTTGTTIFTAPTFNPTRGTGLSHNHGSDDAEAHFTLKDTNRIVLDAQLAVRDLPEAHIYASLTFAYNAYATHAQQEASRAGPFWLLGPDVKSGQGIETLPGVPATIMREYHSDTRIPADKQ